MSENFFDAIKQGKLDEVQRLLSANTRLINEKDNGLSPAMVAVYQHQSAVADFLADKAGSLNIFEASALGKTNQVMRLLAHNPLLVNTYSEDGFQPLGLACFFGQHETTEYLIKAGAPINTSSNNELGAAPIQSATAAGHVEIVTLLLNNNADPNVREHLGYTPLHTAAQNGNLRLISILLFNGADLTIRNKDGKTPSELAFDAGQLKAVNLLKAGITRRFRVVRP